jgi:hypothetical protein
MPENTSNTVPCCVTDIGTGRILWSGVRVIGSSLKSLTLRLHRWGKGRPPGAAEFTLSNRPNSAPLRNLPDLSSVDSVVHSAQEGSS